MRRSGLLLLATGGLFLLGSVSCNNDITGLTPPSDPATETFAAALGVNISQMQRLPNGVYYADVVEGTGDPVVETSDTLVVDYALFLKDGTLVESANNSKLEPAALVVGFRTGVIGMKEGGQRKLVIPSELGYGGTSVRDPRTGKISIPRQSTLIFNVGLLRVHTPDPDAEPTK